MCGRWWWHRKKGTLWLCNQCGTICLIGKCFQNLLIPLPPDILDWKFDCWFCCPSRTELLHGLCAMLNTAQFVSLTLVANASPERINIQTRTRVALAHGGTKESFEWMTGVDVTWGSDKAGYQSATSEEDVNWPLTKFCMEQMGYMEPVYKQAK